MEIFSTSMTHSLNFKRHHQYRHYAMELLLARVIFVIRKFEDDIKSKKR